MYKEKLLLTLIVVIISANTQELSTLGPNLLVNDDFSTPNILPLGVSYKMYPNSVLGWNCSTYCELVDCKRFNLEALNWNSGLFSGNCPSQALDVSSVNIDVISQIFQAQAGKHTLDIKFICPISLSRKKILVVLINQEIVYKFHPFYGDFHHKEVSLEISLIEGYNKISFTMQGKNDNDGFRLFDVKIRRIIVPQVKIVVWMNNYNLMLQNVVAIPCSRVIFGELINTIISLDRMQLYYYHHRKYSKYYDNFLKGINNLLNQKGIYADYISHAFYSLIGVSEESLLTLINYKNGRKYRDGYDRAGFLQNGGFFFIVSYIPVALIIFFILNTLFRLTFNNKFSKILRKYSFSYLIILMLFEGNIEQFSYLIMDEFLEFFQACFRHKILNVMTLVIFYFIVLCSTAFYLYCWYILRKKMSYLTENAPIKMSGMMAYTFDRGLACLVLGSVHRLTLLCGKEQLLILAITQLSLIAFKVSMVFFSSYKCKMFGWMNVIEGLIRLCFQLSILIYEDRGDLQDFIDKEIQLKIIQMFFFIWMFNLAIIIIVVMKQNISQLSRKSYQNKIDQKCSITTKLPSLCQPKNVQKKQKSKVFKMMIMGKMKNMRIRSPQNL